VFFMHSASAVDIYRAQRKHINYSNLTNENFASRFEMQALNSAWEPVRRL
jgi:hypothetical protein